MNTKLNEIAANWWAERFQIADKREEFRSAMLKHLPDSDWELHSDYDPRDLLLTIVREVVPCRGYMFSSQGILPNKTWLIREGNKIRGRDGLNGEWVVVAEEKPE